jgi:hypothetical protein
VRHDVSGVARVHAPRQVSEEEFVRMRNRRLGLALGAQGAACCPEDDGEVMHGLRAAWRLFDADGNGSTTIGELRDGLARLQAVVAGAAGQPAAADAEEEEPFGGGSDDRAVDPEARRTHGARVSEREMVVMMRPAASSPSSESLS